MPPNKPENSEPAVPGHVASTDGLGLNRKGNALLCYAWGETDTPCVRVEYKEAGVRAFIVDAWLGDQNDPELPAIMAEVAAHDWYEDGPKEWRFEIGGVRLEDVCGTDSVGLVERMNKEIFGFARCARAVEENSRLRAALERLKDAALDTIASGVPAAYLDDAAGHAMFVLEA
jgi:hypothetical protein